VVFKKVIKHFEDILFWARTLIRMTAMIKLRHQQPSLWHRGLAEDIEGLWEPWMRLVDELLEDEQLLDTVYEAQGERYPRAGFAVECKRRRKYCCACCGCAGTCRRAQFPQVQGLATL
jgi:hypothetical protein